MLGLEKLLEYYKNNKADFVEIGLFLLLMIAICLILLITFSFGMVLSSSINK